MSADPSPARYLDVCPDCGGSGERDWLSGAACYTCNGTGLIDDTLDDYPIEEDRDHV